MYDSMWWATRLEQHYFGKKFENTPVFLSVDESELSQIAGDIATDPVASLASAVADSVMPGFHFKPILESSHQWFDDGAEGPPPMLPLLAITVLAATRMRVSELGGAPNFYRPFRELLGDDVGTGAPRDFSDAVPACWDLLDRWLTELKQGSFGVSTIRADDHFRNIGYSLRQSLFRGSDRQLVFRWFESIGIEPLSVDVPGRELRKGLALWARRQRATRLVGVLSQETSNNDVERLLERMVETWDGVLPRTPGGQLHANVRLRLPPRRSGKFELSVVFDCDRSIGEVASLETESGQGVTLRFDESTGSYLPDELQQMNKDLLGGILENGLRANTTELSASFDAADVYAFKQGNDPGQYPHWITTRHLRFGEPHHLLVRSAVHRELLAWLENEGVHVAVKAELTCFLPKGWLFVPDVTLDRRPSEQAPLSLADLIRGGNGTLFRLAGGLRVPGIRRAYFTGGPPRIALPADTRDDKLTLEQVDSEYEPLPLSAGSSEYLLNALSLPSGHYRVGFGSSTIDFDLVDGIAERPPDLDSPVLHEGAGGRPVRGLRLAGVQPDLPIELPWNDEYNQVAVFANGQCRPLTVPKWFGEMAGGLSWEATDMWADEDPVWLIELRETGKYRARLLAIQEPELDESSDAAGFILNSVLIDDSENSQSLWDRYCEAIE